MTAEETYLAWLRYALWGGYPPVRPADDEVLRLAERQTTRGLVFEAMLRCGAALPEETVARMKQLLLQILSAHQMLDAAVAQAAGALREAGIPAVLLKGQGAARNYPDPQLRECGDIDLYVGPERLEEALRVLTPLAARVDDRMSGQHWLLRIGPSLVELHGHTLHLPDGRRTRFYQALEADGLCNGLVPLDFGGVRVDTPADTFNAFYLFYHAWHHFLEEGVGLRQLCDWALLLHARRDLVDRERLRAMLDGMHLLTPWQLFGCIAVRDLGLPEDECPFYDPARFAKSRRVLEMILAEGNFGRSRQRRRAHPEGYLAGKAYTFGGYLGRFFRMLRIAPAEACRHYRSTFILKFGTVLKEMPHR